MRSMRGCPESGRRARGTRLAMWSDGRGRWGASGAPPHGNMNGAGATFNGGARCSPIPPRYLHFSHPVPARGSTMALTQPARSGTAPLSRAALALLLAPALLAAPPSRLDAQRARPAARALAPADSAVASAVVRGLRYRMIGPGRGGRVTTVTGIAEQPHTFFFGSTGGGVWKTTDAGQSWTNV